MAETSATKKLGIKSGQRLLILNAPEGYLQALEPLPENTEVKTAAGESFDFIQVFCYTKADVDRYAPTVLQAFKPGGLLWLTYPKKSAKIKTDISRDVGWEAMQSAGMRPVTLVAIDDTWSALRFRPTSEVK